MFASSAEPVQEGAAPVFFGRLVQQGGHDLELDPDLEEHVWAVAQLDTRVILAQVWLAQRKTLAVNMREGEGRAGERGLRAFPIKNSWSR